MPVCPPVKDRNRFTIRKDYDTGSKQRRTLKLLNDAAVFACVRWTNLFFPGDFVGARLRKVFGKGIKDVRVLTGKKRYRSYLPSSHTLYWSPDAGSGGNISVKGRLALDELRKALRLKQENK